MKIVIDIPEKRYKDIQRIAEVQLDRRTDTVEQIVAKGTPLPKGHGDLKDADSLIKAIEEKAKRLSNADTINGLCGAVALIFDEQTIIEANKEKEE